MTAAALVMRIWKWSRDHQLLYVPRPPAVGRAHSSGFNADRVLLIGSGMAVGWGLTSQDIALAGSLARALTSRTGRAADVHFIADPTMTTKSLLRAVSTLKLRRYDAIVVTIGVDDALRLTPVFLWRRNLLALTSYLDDHSPISARKFMVGIQPIRSIPAYAGRLGSIAESHATRLNLATREICATQPRTRFVPTTAPPLVEAPRFRDGSTYLYWAEEIADVVAPGLDEARASVRPDVEHDAVDSGSNRVGAVSKLGTLVGPPQTRLDTIVKQAMTALGGTGAAFGLIEGGRIRFTATAGDAPSVVEYEGSFTAAAIAKRGAFVVADAMVDERFRLHPHVVGNLAVRFWAGFPIELDSGERVGVLCVFGPRPKPLGSEIDRTVLRALALTLQHELRQDGSVWG